MKNLFIILATIENLAILAAIVFLILKTDHWWPMFLLLSVNSFSFKHTPDKEGKGK